MSLMEAAGEGLEEGHTGPLLGGVILGCFWLAWSWNWETVKGHTLAEMLKKLDVRIGL